MKAFIVLAVLAVAALTANAKNVLHQAETRIVNGIEATEFQFPYLAAIYATDDGIVGLKCGGTIISESIILTAAHCFEISTTGVVSVGSNKFLEGDLIAFTKVKIHEDYDTETHLNDIALVFLTRPVKPDGVTIKIASYDVGRLPEYSIVTISGFGKISDAQDSNQLYYAKLFSISEKLCGDIFGVNHETQVCCYGGPTISPCQGDSGSPIVRDWPKGPVVVGILSYGVKSCEVGLPTVFTRTAAYNDWIDRNAFGKP